MYSIFYLTFYLFGGAYAPNPTGLHLFTLTGGVIVGNAVADFLAVDILNIILQGAAAMRPLASCLL